MLSNYIMFRQNLLSKEGQSSVQLLAEVRGEEQKEGQCQKVRGKAEKRSDLMVVDSATIEDVLSLRQKVATLSKISLHLSRKMVEQSERLAQSLEETEQMNAKHQAMTRQNQELKSQVKSMKLRQQQLQNQLLIIQKQSQTCKYLSPSKEQQQLAQRERNSLLSRIEDLTFKVDTLSTELESKNTQIARLHHIANDLQITQAKFIVISERLNKVEQELSTTRQENIQLKKDLQIHEESEKSQQLIIQKLIQQSESDIIKAQLVQSEKQYNEIKKKYKVIKHNHQQLKIEFQYMKERYETSQHDERDLDHAVIDRFIKAMREFRNKLVQKGKREFMEIKKRSFFQRLDQEYQKLLEE